MQTIAHLSDLHFGRIDESLIDPLVEAVGSRSPDLVAISGDLTQYARTQEFFAARALIHRLCPSVLIVPGNHDLSFYNPLRRAVQGLGLYKRIITSELEPLYEAPGLRVMGLNSARVPLFRGGRFSKAQLAKVEAHMQTAPEGTVRVLVTHHPFDLPAAYPHSELVRGSRSGMPRLLKAVDLLLAGHMHASHSGATAERYQIAGHSAVFVQAGTALSRRVRGEANSFNLLSVEPRRIRVEVWTAQGGRFAPVAAREFHQQDGIWEAASR